MKPGFDANDWACAGFAVAHAGAHRAAGFEETWGFLLAALVERPTLGLPTAAFDWGSLLLGHPLGPFKLDVPTVLRDALRDWEDHVLARLTFDRRWVLLQEAYAAQPAELKPTVAGLLIATWAERLSLSSSVSMSVGKLRALGKRGLVDVLAHGIGVVSQEGPLVTELSAALRRASAAARKTRELVTDAEVFLAENAASLKGLASRVALAQAAQATQTLLESAPGRMKARRDNEAEVPTQAEEEDAYPIGGFSSITTRGSLENLVTSELAYMDDGDADRPDFFDIRFVDDALLYYARDESMAFRKKRVVAFIFDASLTRARVVDEGQRYQRLLWVQALCAALVRRLGQWLTDEGLAFQLWFVKEGGEAPLSEEAGVLWLLLREFRQSGRVTFHEAATLDEAVKALDGAHSQRLEVVVATAAAGPELKTRAHALMTILVDQPSPKLEWRGAGKKVAAQSEDGLTWPAAFKQLLRVLP